MDYKPLQKIKYGMYIVSSRKGDKFNGQIANTVFQITAEPVTMAVSISKQNFTHDYIAESGVFSVSVLTVDAPMTLIGQFGFKSGRDIDKFANVDFKTGQTGAPVVLDHSAAWLEAKVISSTDCGTHTLFIGEVVNCENIKDTKTMSYNFYHRIKGGFTPKNAPTYQKPPKKEQETMKKYKCKVCGYVYEPEKGDPEADIRAGTPFEKLPENWKCPVCGAPKSEFEPV
ncbi:MAG: flavin reductase [Endomicrobiales bacterium]|nr:flavin reductase [Endomicrobiales bacterium]